MDIIGADTTPAEMPRDNGITLPLLTQPSPAKLTPGRPPGSPRLTNVTVEEHRSLGGSIISGLDNGAFVGLIYELLVFY